MALLAVMAHLAVMARIRTGSTKILALFWHGFWHCSGTVLARVPALFLALVLAPLLALVLAP